MIKPDTVLLIDADGDCEDIVARAAARLAFRVRWVRTSREAFQFLSSHTRNLALIVVDVDPGAHGMAILSAVTECAESPGIVVLTALEQTYAEPISRSHGAAACLGKPVDIEKLSHTIRDVTAHHFSTCDLWGHVQPRRASADHRAALRGIATKLTPRLARRVYV